METKITKSNTNSYTPFGYEFTEGLSIFSDSHVYHNSESFFLINFFFSSIAVEEYEMIDSI
jgi:hypothetical protein